jgi:hypothetical protein
MKLELEKKLYNICRSVDELAIIERLLRGSLLDV